MENASDDFPQHRKLENLLPNFAGSSPSISPKTSPTSLWESLMHKKSGFLKRALAQAFLRAWYQVRFFRNIFGHSWVASPLACYRVRFGPQEKNRKNIGFGLPRPSPGKKGKNSRKIGKWSQIPIFRLFFPYFPGEGLGRPKPTLGRRPTGSHSWGLVYGEGGAPGTVPLHNLGVTSHVLHQKSALGKWGRTQMGSDGFNRILTGFYLSGPVRVRLVPSRPPKHMISRGFYRVITGF